MSLFYLMLLMRQGQGNFTFTHGTPVTRHLYYFLQTMKPSENHTTSNGPRQFMACGRTYLG